MTLQEALLKIIELQQEVINLRKQLSAPIITQFPQTTWIDGPFRAPDLCIGDGLHDFPSPWFGTTPPVCKKCGRQAGMINVSY